MVPPKCSLSEADYETNVLLVRLGTTWIEAYQISLPQIVPAVPEEDTIAILLQIRYCNSLH
jgi:hypothetical protein